MGRGGIALLCFVKFHFALFSMDKIRRNTKITPYSILKRACFCIFVLEMKKKILAPTSDIFLGWRPWLELTYFSLIFAGSIFRKHLLKFV